jgi:hypothetical protein
MTVEWGGRMLRIVPFGRGPKRVTIGRVGAWYYAHFIIIGFAFRGRLPRIPEI